MKRKYESGRYGNCRASYNCCSSSDETFSSSTDGDEVIDYLDFAEGINRNLTSSPVKFLNEESKSFEDIESDNSDNEESTPLYFGAEVTYEKFVTEFGNIVARHNLSDVCSDSILKLISESLPSPNCCPKLAKLKRESKVDTFYSQTVHNNGTYYFVDLEIQLKEVLDNYPSIFSDFRHESSDLRNSKHFSFSQSGEKKYLFLLLNIDGLASIFQSRQYKIWTIMASLINLPPEERRRFRNLLLISLYYGKEKPDFNFFLQSLVSTVKSFSMIYSNLTIELRVVTLTADLPAKSEALTMTQFNGYYGCTLCNMKGSYSREYHKMLFPFGETFQLRSPETYQQHLRTAVCNKAPYFGVKGPTPLSLLMEIPILPLDPLHLLFLGIVRSIMMHLFKHKLVNENSVSEKLICLRVPSFFRRKPRSLIFKAHFKALEWRNLILYYSGLLFQNQNTSVQSLLILLSTLIYTFMKRNVSDNDCDDMSVLITEFQRVSLRLFGDSVQSYSMHAMQHLPYLVQRFGALWAVSTAPFESAFFRLKRPLSGTRNEGKLLVERFLRNKTLYRHSSLPNAVTDGPESSIVGNTIRMSSMNDKSHFLSYGYFSANDDFYAFRFRRKKIVFHSKEYSSCTSSASFYGYTSDNNIVQIDHIILRDRSIFCLCTTLDKCDLSDDVLLPPDVKRIVKKHSATYKVQWGAKSMIPAESLSLPVVVVECNNTSFATPVLENFDIE